VEAAGSDTMGELLLLSRTIFFIVDFVDWHALLKTDRNPNGIVDAG
jgi:hypothetical protein